MSHVRIKICGITSAADASQAAALGAEAIGLNFYAGSPRRVTPAVARQILGAVPLFVDAVGLFVNTNLAEALARVQEFGRIRTLQLHGERAAPAAALPFRLIAAFAVKGTESLRDIQQYLGACGEAGQL